MTSTPRPLLAAAVAATVLLWGSAFVGIRATLPALGYANLASGRLLLAALTFAVLARRLGVRRPTSSQLPLLAALGATGYAGYQLLLSAGEQTVPAGTSALLFSGAPVLAALLARPILHERLSARSWSGLAVAVTGVTVVATTQGISGSGLGGAPFVLAAVALYGLWVVLQKRALATMSAVDVTAWATWLGAGFALPFASGLPHAVTTAPASALASLLLLGIIVTTVPFLLWTWTLARVKATTAAPFLLLVSPAALVVAWLWLGEAPALAALAGGALTLAGVATVQLGAPTAPPIPSPPNRLTASTATRHCARANPARRPTGDLCLPEHISGKDNSGRDGTPAPASTQASRSKPTRRPGAPGGADRRDAGGVAAVRRRPGAER